MPPGPGGSSRGKALALTSEGLLGASYSGAHSFYVYMFSFSKLLIKNAAALYLSAGIYKR